MTLRPAPSSYWPASRFVEAPNSSQPDGLRGGGLDHRKMFGSRTGRPTLALCKTHIVRSRSKNRLCRCHQGQPEGPRRSLCNVIDVLIVLEGEPGHVIIEAFRNPTVRQSRHIFVDPGLRLRLVKLKHMEISRVTDIEHT